MRAEAVAFGSRLRDARERKGITLDAVAESTKIAVAFLAALERGDISRWPQGIFRRAFVREYARAIGLPVGTTLSDFFDVFPEDSDPRIDSATKEPTDELRLTLATDDARFNREVIFRVLAAMLDLALIAAIGRAISAAVYVVDGAVVSWWAMSGVFGLIYYTLSTAWFGRTAASSWLDVKTRRTEIPVAAPTRLQPRAPVQFPIPSRRRGPRRITTSTNSDLEPTEEVPPAIAAGG